MDLKSIKTDADMAVEAADTEPLVGMSLLDQHVLRIEVVSGGVVTITALP